MSPLLEFESSTLLCIPPPQARTYMHLPLLPQSFQGTMYQGGPANTLCPYSHRWLRLFSDHSPAVVGQIEGALIITLQDNN